MAAIVWADVVAHASTLAGVDPGQQDDLLCVANSFLNVGMFDGEDGCKTKLARVYLVAHFASLPGAGSTAGGATAAGPVTSESTGGVSRAYAAIAGGNASAGAWSETIWGRRYLLLVKTSKARWPTVA